MDGAENYLTDIQATAHRTSNVQVQPQKQAEHKKLGKPLNLIQAYGLRPFVMLQYSMYGHSVNVDIY